MRHSALRRFLAACTAGALVSACCFLHPFLKQEVRPLTYRYHDSIPAHWIGPIDRAASTWNATTSMFVSGGGGGAGTYAADGINSIFLYPLLDPAYLAAVGFSSWDFCGIQDTDMGWSTLYGFSTTGGNPDVETVALHEFGHYGWLGHVICPRNAVMLDTYVDVRRQLSGCDRFGMFISNALPECFPAMGICRPTFLFGLFAAFDDIDEESQQMLQPFKNHDDELVQIWSADTALRNTSDSVGSFYDAMADDWRNGGTSAHNEVFTWDRYWELDSQIISRVYQSASSPLRADLDTLRQNLQGKVGLTLAQIFSGDVAQYEPALYGGGGGTGDGDGCQDEQQDPRQEIRIVCGQT